MIIRKLSDYLADRKIFGFYYRLHLGNQSNHIILPSVSLRFDNNTMIDELTQKEI